jgi:hypothetical protein
MGLKSNLFRGDPALEACLVDHAAHVCEGAVGTHVSKIHTALYVIDRLDVSADELRSHRYGKSTAAAVLTFKRRRNIVNTTYQTQPDDIVGKMTIERLDSEMSVKESEPYRAPSRKDYGTSQRY